MTIGAVTGLVALEARLREDLALLELPAKPWVPPRPGVTDVVVIGGGMAGLAAAAALQLAGISNMRVLDRAPAGLEGPWATFARMETLRSPKQLTGPALGLPALTFRAWFTAQFGAEAWQRLGKIPRLQWMEYLVWYRRVMDVPVENSVTMTGLFPAAAELRVETAAAGILRARHVVLATGRDGLGGPFVPEIARALDRGLWAHSRDVIDFGALRGRRVAVLGAGASAMDNAAEALEHGAARLDLFVRRPALPRINKMTGVGSFGLTESFAALPDDWKWRLMHYSNAEQTPPPRDSTLRVARHAQAHLHLSSPVLAVAPDGGGVRIETPTGQYKVDFVIFATGFMVDLAARPELAAIAPHVRMWRDRFTPPPGMDSEELAWSPDLAADFSFQEKEAGTCPGLTRVHCFNFPATLSHGKLTGDIPAISNGAQRLVSGIARRLYAEDVAKHYQAMQDFSTPELLGDEWPERITAG